MNLFDKYVTLIEESVIDIPRNSLDPTVFNFTEGMAPTLMPSIKLQIIQDVTRIADLIPVQNFFMIGSILTKRYSPYSDIDVNIEVQPHGVDDIYISAAMKFLKQVNGRKATGTAHPINYFIITKPFDFSKAEAAYDIANDKWIKQANTQEIDINDYIAQFERTVQSIDLNNAEIRRDLIDVNDLLKWEDDKVVGAKDKIHEKLKKINLQIQGMVEVYENIKDLRYNAFEKEMSPDQIQKYGQKANLPENVVYKLLERYYYIDFLRKLETLVGHEEIKPSDLKEVRKFSNAFWRQK
jgi:hypothetical protein